ncbi:MAG TPA: hypothetical protein VGJ18_25615 [Gemmatimonadaceae bacterium]|jgi:hypothetical protein
MIDCRPGLARRRSADGRERVTRMALIAAITCVPLGSAALAQEPSRTTWRDQSIAGSTAVDLDTYFVRVHTEYAPLQTGFWGNANIAPFVTPHWQLGVAPTWETNSTATLGRYSGGDLALTANYVPWNDGASAFFVGGWLARYGQSLNSPSTGVGAQVGWLQFLSPNFALHAEARYRHIDTPRSQTLGDVFVRLDSYLFGRANRPPVSLPSLGTVDVSMFGNFNFQPSHSLTLDLLAAPFLTNWLQLGGASDLDFFFDESSSDRYFEGFVRGYLPLSTRFAPLVQLYADRESFTYNDNLVTHGLEVGARTYLAPGLALDVSWEWRNFRNGQPEERLLRARLRSQIRVARGGGLNRTAP